MSSEQLNRTAVKDARLKDLLLERGTPSFGRGARAGSAAGAGSPPYRSKTRPGPARPGSAGLPRALGRRGSLLAGGVGLAAEGDLGVTVDRVMN